MGDPIGSKAEQKGETRGTQYPADNLQSAIEALEKVKSGVGYSSASRDSIAEALGYKDAVGGAAGRRLGLLTHFGLLDRVGKGAMRISALGKSILMPTSEEERARAIAVAAKSPRLYSALIERHAGHGLPTLLANQLAREFGVHNSVAEAAARTFRESMEFAGLLRNGILHTSLSEVDSDEERSGTKPLNSRDDLVEKSPLGGPLGRSTPSSHATLPTPPTPPGTSGFTIPLDNAGRMATIYVPLPLTARDIKKLAAWVSYMSSILEDEEPPSIG